MQIENRNGSITYISSRNIYVKFENTDSIKINDTLYFSQGGQTLPAVVVKYISSKSCAGEKIINVELKLDDRLFAKIETYVKKQLQSEPDNDSRKNIIKDINSKTIRSAAKNIKNSYLGRFSVQSVSSFSNTPNNDDQRWRYSFLFNADSINSTGFSFSSYFFFAYNVKKWNEIKNSLGSAFKIYDLAIGYTFSNKSKIWLGRFLNPKLSNVGSIDGVQYQNHSGRYYFGAALGSHPGFADYGYNAKLFEYGGYLGRVDSFANSQMENTFAFMNQTNNFNTDRRYIYYQHTNNIIPNTNIFASSELDLYKIETGVAKNKIDLTSLFLSLYFTPFRELSLSLSFDARKNAIYYETYKTYLDYLMSNELRKGYRASIYLRPLDNISINLNGGYSYQSGDPKPARNFGANIYCNRIPLINISGNISFSKLTSGYTDGTISGLRMSEYFNTLDLNFSIDYKNIKYEFYSDTEPMIQNIISAETSYNFPFKISFSLNYEGVFEKQNSWGRFFIDLTKRF